MDFYEFSRQTGETFKFYPVSAPNSTTASPSSTSALNDSGYGSSFNPSPVVSDMSLWVQPAIAYASNPATSQSPRMKKPRPSSAKKPATLRQTDFSTHQGCES